MLRSHLVFFSSVSFSCHLFASHNVENGGSGAPGGELLSALEHLDVLGISESVVETVDEFLILPKQLGTISLLRHVVILEIIRRVVDTVLGIFHQSMKETKELQ